MLKTNSNSGFFRVSKLAIVSIIVICFVFMSSGVAFAATEEKEPNNNFKKAQTVKLGEEYNGILEEDDDEDVDYYM